MTRQRFGQDQGLVEPAPAQSRDMQRNRNDDVVVRIERTEVDQQATEAWGESDLTPVFESVNGNSKRRVGVGSCEVSEACSSPVERG